jgi:probable HAF family extracellular repeat protein
MDLNDQGQIVGWLMLDSGEIRAFLATPNNQG